MNNCKCCDNNFEPTVSYQIYCSPNCRDIATKEKIAARYLQSKRQKRHWLVLVNMCVRNRALLPLAGSLFIIKNNGVIEEDFILTELAESINKNSFEIQNRHMSSDVSYVDKIDFRLKRFVDLYHDLLDERIFKQSTILQEYVGKKNDTQSVCYDKNIDTFIEQFPYLHKDIILVLLYHVVHNKFLSAVNGHIVAKPRFIHDSKMLINQESKNFIKELKELHSSMLGNSHILVRCDDKDVCKLFKKASYVKM